MQDWQSRSYAQSPSDSEAGAGTGTASPGLELALHEPGCLHSPHGLHPSLFLVTRFRAAGEQNPLDGVRTGLQPQPGSCDTRQVQRDWENEKLPSLEATGHRPRGLGLPVEQVPADCFTHAGGSRRRRMRVNDPRLLLQSAEGQRRGSAMVRRCNQAMRSSGKH